MILGLSVLTSTPGKSSSISSRGLSPGSLRFDILAWTFGGGRGNSFTSSKGTTPRGSTVFPVFISL